jgi:hypothetical protein
MSPLDPDVPPAGEEIHLPGNTIQPLVLTVGITLLLIGLTTWIGFLIAGGVITVWTILHWIRDTRRDIAELPPEAH